MDSVMSLLTRPELHSQPSTLTSTTTTTNEDGTTTTTTTSSSTGGSTLDPNALLKLMSSMGSWGGSGGASGGARGGSSSRSSTTGGGKSRSKWGRRNHQEATINEGSAYDPGDDDPSHRKSRRYDENGEVCELDPVFIFSL
jgi:hypothetical protein